MRRAMRPQTCAWCHRIVHRISNGWAHALYVDYDDPEESRCRECWHLWGAMVRLDQFLSKDLTGWWNDETRTWG